MVTNGDGRPDVLVLTRDGQISIHENPGKDAPCAKTLEKSNCNKSEPKYAARVKAPREGLSFIAELVARMRACSLNSLHRKGVEAMTTRETSFVRDLNPLEALHKVVLPDLFQVCWRKTLADLVRREFNR